VIKLVSTDLHSSPRALYDPCLNARVIPNYHNGGIPGCGCRSLDRTREWDKTGADGNLRFLIICPPSWIRTLAPKSINFMSGFGRSAQ
jgi:hypothetical protein